MILMVGLSIALPIVAMGAYGDQEQYCAEPFDGMSDEVAVEDLEDVHDVGKIRLSVGGSNDLENGALYTHWGSSTCNEGSHLAYSGFVGGPWYSLKGGAAQYL